MDVLSYLNELRGGVAPGQASEQDFVGWSHAESESQVARNAHRLNQGLELAARLDELGWGQRGPLLQQYSKLTGRKKSVLYDRAATARKLVALLSRAGEVSGFPEESVLDVAWDGLLEAFAEALGLESEGSGRSGSGSSGGIAALWQSWLGKMGEQAGDDLENLELLEQLLAAAHEEVRRKIAEKRAEAEAGAVEVERPAVEPGPVREAPEEVLDEPTLVGERTAEPGRVRRDVEPAVAGRSEVEAEGAGERSREAPERVGRRRRR